MKKIIIAITAALFMMGCDMEVEATPTWTLSQFEFDWDFEISVSQPSHERIGNVFRWTFEFEGGWELGGATIVVNHIAVDDIWEVMLMRWPAPNIFRSDIEEPTIMDIEEFQIWAYPINVVRVQ